MLNRGGHYRFVHIQLGKDVTQDAHSQCFSNAGNRFVLQIERGIMARILVVNLKYLSFVFLYLTRRSWTQIDCRELDAPTCNYVLMFEQSGISKSVVYEIATSNTDKCVFRISINELHHHTTIRCLKNAPRIVYGLHFPLDTRQLAIKNCVIYWKDLLWMPGGSNTELILDDWEDEFITEDSDYLQQCVPSWHCGQRFKRSAIPNFPMRVHLLSSVARPLSEAFWNCTLQDINELYIKGWGYSFPDILQIVIH